MQIIGSTDSLRIFIEEGAVGLQMHDSALLEELAVTVQEHRTCKTAVLALHLRVRECQPDFRNLARSKESLDKFNAGTQESHVGKIVLGSVFRTLPQSGTLDVHTDIVHLGITLGKSYGIFTLSAPKFQNHRTLPAVEHLFAPMPLDRMVPEIQWSP